MIRLFCYECWEYVEFYPIPNHAEIIECSKCGRPDTLPRIDEEFLEENPFCILVFGDDVLNKNRLGYASLRDLPNTFGFIVKKLAKIEFRAYYTPNEYQPVFESEFKKFEQKIKNNPDYTFLISRLTAGKGMGNKHYIYETIIRDGLAILDKYPNVVFLESA